MPALILLVMAVVLFPVAVALIQSAGGATLLREIQRHFVRTGLAARRMGGDAVDAIVDAADVAVPWSMRILGWVVVAFIVTVGLIGTVYPVLIDSAWLVAFLVLVPSVFFSVFVGARANVRDMSGVAPLLRRSLVSLLGLGLHLTFFVAPFYHMGHEVGVNYNGRPMAMLGVWCLVTVGIMVVLLGDLVVALLKEGVDYVEGALDLLWRLTLSVVAWDKGAVLNTLKSDEATKRINVANQEKFDKRWERRKARMGMSVLPILLIALLLPYWEAYLVAMFVGLVIWLATKILEAAGEKDEVLAAKQLVMARWFVRAAYVLTALVMLFVVKPSFEARLDKLISEETFGSLMTKASDGILAITTLSWWWLSLILVVPAVFLYGIVTFWKAEEGMGKTLRKGVIAVFAMMVIASAFVIMGKAFRDQKGGSLTVYVRQLNAPEQKVVVHLMQKMNDDDPALKEARQLSANGVQQGYIPLPQTCMTACEDAGATCDRSVCTFAGLEIGGRYRVYATKSWTLTERYIHLYQDNGPAETIEAGTWVTGQDDQTAAIPDDGRQTIELTLRFRDAIRLQPITPPAAPIRVDGSVPVSTTSF